MEDKPTKCLLRHNRVAFRKSTVFLLGKRKDVARYQELNSALACDPNMIMEENT